MSNSIRQAGIIGTGSAVPGRVVTNADLEKIIDTTDEWIKSRSGISERRLVSEGEAASDLATTAAKAALASAGLSPEDIDLIIVATFTGDMPIPSTSCIVQNNIGASRAAAFDLQAGCSGFVYSLSVASSMVASGAYDKILVIGADVLSSMTNWDDRATCVLFGDGSGAAVVAPVGEGEGMLSFCLGADGSGGDLLTIKAGGSRLPPSMETVQNKQHYIEMSGREVFKFAVRIMGDAAMEALEKCGLSPADVDLFIPHQANIRIIEAAARRLELPEEKVFLNVQKYGNTSAASIPIAIDEAYRSGLLKKGDVVVVVGFGAGLTWAAATLKWVI
ncbi:MAG: beta-ketoacyl-ACP synthase III [Armatimonadota bacterium]|nr:beta-ketoacyl-ACP synthase III [Armatimonadota bacterium]